MGLDMYIERFPIIKGIVNGVEQILEPYHFNIVDSWVGYQEYLKKPLRDDETEKSSWEGWVGEEDAKNLPSAETLETLKPFIQVRYWDWDTEHKFPHTMISEQVGYWRKANQIHNWFVENVQDGEDDCRYHRPITALDLEKLKSACERVLNSLNLQKGKIVNGYSMDKNMNRVYHYEDGLVATDTDLAEELLPTQSGFFFGGTDYDEYYAEDLQSTIDICNNILETTDFNTQQVYYCSSW